MVIATTSCSLRNVVPLNDVELHELHLYHWAFVRNGKDTSLACSLYSCLHLQSLFRTTNHHVHNTVNRLANMGHIRIKLKRLLWKMVSLLKKTEKSVHLIIKGSFILQILWSLDCFVATRLGHECIDWPAAYRVNALEMFDITPTILFRIECWITDRPEIFSPTLKYYRPVIIFGALILPKVLAVLHT